MKQQYNIDVELKEEKYKQGYYAKNTYNINNPLNPKVTYTDIATTEDVIHEFCHCILISEGYPRVIASNNNDSLILSHLESVIEHGRVVELGNSYGVDLRIDKRQMDKLEQRLVNESRFLDNRIEGIFYADMTIRCSDQEWWDKMQKVYEEKLPAAYKMGKRILKEVEKFNWCKNVADATTCHKILAKDLKIKNVKYMN